MKPLMICSAVIFAAICIPADARDIGASDFVYVSDLSNDGFVPFPASGSANASFGMMKGADLYLCFIADNAENQSLRQSVIVSALEDEASPREVPNIPIVCVLTE